MKIESVFIKSFRNLKDFRIDFSEMKTVLIGQNASGKSNFLEAIVLIFKQLDFPNNIPKEEWFEYEIIYWCYNQKIKLSRSLKKNKEENLYSIFTGNKDAFGEDIYTSIKGFKLNKDKYLPKYIFAYYSGLGNSNRLEEHFQDHKIAFARQSLNATIELPSYPRMLYAELIHSHFSLFSFFIEDQDKDNEEDIKRFLLDNLAIEGIQSILLTIEEPYWSNVKMKAEDPKFFGSRGLVKELLYHIHDEVAFAPLRSVDNNRSEWSGKAKKQVEQVNLFISDFQKISNFISTKGWSKFDFFHILNTMPISQLLSSNGIKIRVKKRYADRILFKNLSEGEQQLLTVLGLMRFTNTDEALFLLDEPDTHLNPLWQWKYLEFINLILGDNKEKSSNQTTQVIMSSHAPLTIGGLNKEGVRVFRESDSQIKAYIPSEDPKGMGVAGILTEIFNIPTTLDIETNRELERRRHIQSMIFNLEKYKIPIPENENIESIKEELEILNEKLDNLGFARVTRDPLYQEFQAKFDKEMKYMKASLKPLSVEEQEERDKIMEDILKDLLNLENL